MHVYAYRAYTCVYVYTCMIVYVGLHVYLGGGLGNLGCTYVDVHVYVFTHQPNGKEDLTGTYTIQTDKMRER